MKKPIEAPSHLNAQQVAALEKDIRAKLDTLVKDVELRKWAIEQAFANLVGVDSTERMSAAEQIYNFISQRLNEPLVAMPLEPAERS